MLLCHFQHVFVLQATHHLQQNKKYVLKHLNHSTLITLTRSDLLLQRLQKNNDIQCSTQLFKTKWNQDPSAAKHIRNHILPQYHLLQVPKPGQLAFSLLSREQTMINCSEVLSRSILDQIIANFSNFTLMSFISLACSALWWASSPCTDISLPMYPQQNKKGDLAMRNALPVIHQLSQTCKAELSPQTCFLAQRKDPTTAKATPLNYFL